MLAVAFLGQRKKQIKMVKTTLQELQEHLQIDVQLKFLQQKDVDRINYYIDTFFKEKEQKQIEDAEHQAASILKEAELRAETIKKEKQLEAKREKLLQLEANEEVRLLTGLSIDK